MHSDLEVQLAFWGLLAWHGLLAGLKYRARQTSKRVPFVTVLMLIQVCILAYLIEDWIYNPFNGRGKVPQLRWFAWVIFEVSVFLAAILGCMLSLVFRALFPLFYGDKEATGREAKDILEQYCPSVDKFNMFMGPGFSYGVLDLLMHELLRKSHPDKDISGAYNHWVWLFILSGLAFSVGKYAKIYYEKVSGCTNKNAARLFWWMILLVLLINGIVAISCIYAYIAVDKRAIMTPLITFQLLSALQIFFICWKMLSSLKPLREDPNNGDDAFEKADDKSENKTPGEKTEKKKAVVPRLGDSLELDSDMYAWSYLGCFDANYLAIQLFLADWKEGEEKRGEERVGELKTAKLQLQIAENALEGLPEGLRGAAEDLGDTASSKE